MSNASPSSTSSPLTVFWIFLRLGLTAFGGPIAHLAYFREAFVSQRQWLSERGYADLVALCQFLPGPASSQVGLAIGYARAGYAGALAAWLGFTLPAAVLMIALGVGLAGSDWSQFGAVVQGLKLVALAVVAQAIWGMSQSLCPDRGRLSLMLASCFLMLWFPGPWSQLSVLMGAGLLGYWGVFGQQPVDMDNVQMASFPASKSRLPAYLKITAFFLLLALPSLLLATQNHALLTLFDAFYRSGALVFGGGHVVLPLLEAEVVQSGWVEKDAFLAGYGAAQAIPGPLFSFAAFLGSVANQGPGGIAGGILALVAIFLPAFLLVLGVLPFWDRLRRHHRANNSLRAVNAAVVGLLLAAFFTPLWSSTIASSQDIALALLAFGALVVWRMPPWLVVLVFAAGGFVGPWLHQGLVTRL